MTSYVVKLGGHALDSVDSSSEILVALARDVEMLRRAGNMVVIVHGGGPQITSLLDAVGTSSHFVDGLRVTDDDTMEYVAMALGHVNLRLVAAMGTCGLDCVGLSGADGFLMMSNALGGAWGRAGETPQVDVRLIEVLLRAGITPVVYPVGLDSRGDLVNCNADTAAGALARALRAHCLVLLSDVDQLRADYADEGSALASVDSKVLHQLIDDGVVRDGMRPKMIAALDALDAGAARVVMANGTIPHALRDALARSIDITEVVP